MQNKEERLKKLNDLILQCQACSLYKTRTKMVFGEGSLSAKIIYVGESPGRDEDLSGRPFVGRSGQLLRKMIQAIEIPPEDYYIANILKDHPPKNRSPEKEEIEVCVK